MEREKPNETPSGAGRSDGEPPTGYGGEETDLRAEAGRKSGEAKTEIAEGERQEPDDLE